ncbi:MAG: thioredoxin-dependent thiol peroxidase [Candidatus Sericytochromatia bacterium]
MLNIGDKAPSFTANNQDNKTIKLEDFNGKKVVLYFYPKDDTPGCTKEACSFRDNFDELSKLGIEVIGVSADNSESHKKFQNKYSLQFNLISDTEKKVINSYDVFKEKNMYGKKIMGIVRTTFLIDEKGTIVHIFKKPKSEIHATEVLDKFKTL